MYGTTETYAEQMKAEHEGCFICGARPTIWTVKDRGYCGKHKSYAEDARKRLAVLIESFYGIAVGARNSFNAKRGASSLPRNKGLGRIHRA